MSIFFVLLGLALASASKQDWRELDREELDPQQRHTLVFATRQSERGLRALEEVVLGSRGFLSRRQVAALTDHEAASLAIERYLRTRGVSVDRRSRFGEYIHASATIAQWEDILKARFLPYAWGREVVARSATLIIPAAIRDQVRSVLYSSEFTPVNALVPFKRVREGTGLRAGAATEVNSALIARHYNVSRMVAGHESSQRIFDALSLSEFNLDGGEDFLSYIFHAADQEHPKFVQTISFGCDESDMPPAYSALFEIEMLKVSRVHTTLPMELTVLPSARRPRGHCSRRLG